MPIYHSATYGRRATSEFHLFCSSQIFIFPAVTTVLSSVSYGCLENPFQKDTKSNFNTATHEEATTSISSTNFNHHYCYSFFGLLLIRKFWLQPSAIGSHMLVSVELKKPPLCPVFLLIKHMSYLCICYNHLSHILEKKNQTNDTEFLKYLSTYLFLKNITNFFEDFLIIPFIFCTFQVLLQCTPVHNEIQYNQYHNQQCTQK